MRKTFTVTGENGQKIVSVEAETRVDAIDKAMRLGLKDLNKVQGPRFTDSLRSKRRKRTDSEALGQVAYLGTRAAVRHLNSLRG